MKTIFDLALFVKRNGNVLIAVDDGKFVVSTLKTETSSKHLDDALDNLAEQLRRHASGMVLGDAPIAPSVPAPASTMSSTLVMASCGTATMLGGTCPKCNALPYCGSLTDFYCGGCGAVWPLQGTGRFAMRPHAAARVVYYLWDGAQWTQVP
jgi:hypothetical protein